MFQITTVNDIIRLSYNLTSAFTFENVPSSNDISFGLTLLNLIIRTDPTGAQIPFYRQLNFPLVVNQEMYTIGPNGPDFVSPAIRDISTAYVTLINVNYPLKPLTRYEYFGLTNREIVTGVPRNYFFENTISDTTQLYIYPRPDQAYQITLAAKTDLDALTLYTPITQVPEYYYQYLIYMLAAELKNYRPSSVWNETKERKMLELKALVEAASDKDLTIITTDSRQFRNRGVITIYTGGA